MDSAQRIRAVFDRSVEEGLRAEPMAGASDEEIDEMAAAQGAAAVPASVRAVLRLIGRRSGLWLAGSAVGTRVREPAKGGALATLRSCGDPLRDSAGALVLVDHQAYEYHVIDGADLGSDDPPVWLVVEGDEPVRRWESVTAWFESTRPEVDGYRARLRLMRELGDDSASPWAEYVDLG